MPITRFTLTLFGLRSASRVESFAITLLTANRESAKLKTNIFFIVVIFKGLYLMFVTFLDTKVLPKTTFAPHISVNRQIGEVKRNLCGVNRLQPLLEIGDSSLRNDDSLGCFDNKVECQAASKPDDDILYSLTRDDKLTVGSIELIRW